MQQVLRWSGLAPDAIYFLGLCFVFLICLKTQSGNCCWFKFITVKLRISFRDQAWLKGFTILVTGHHWPSSQPYLCLCTSLVWCHFETIQDQVWPKYTLQWLVTIRKWHILSLSLSLSVRLSPSLSVTPSTHILCLPEQSDTTDRSHAILVQHVNFSTFFFIPRTQWWDAFEEKMCFYSNNYLKKKSQNLHPVVWYKRWNWGNTSQVMAKEKKMVYIWLTQFYRTWSIHLKHQSADTQQWKWAESAMNCKHYILWFSISDRASIVDVVLKKITNLHEITPAWQCQQTQYFVKTLSKSQLKTKHAEFPWDIHYPWIIPKLCVTFCGC